MPGRARGNMRNGWQVITPSGACGCCDWATRPVCGAARKGSHAVMVWGRPIERLQVQARVPPAAKPDQRRVAGAGQGGGSSPSTFTGQHEPVDGISDHGVEPAVVRGARLVKGFIGSQRLVVHLVEGAPELLNREGIRQRYGPKPIDDQGDAVRFDIDAAVQVDLVVDPGGGLVDVLDAVQVGSVSLPIAVGLLVMMYPVLAEVRYGETARVTADRRLMAASLVLNWLVGPALMFARRSAMCRFRDRDD
jgi:hypothetical protein